MDIEIRAMPQVRQIIDHMNSWVQMWLRVQGKRQHFPAPFCCIQGERTCLARSRRSTNSPPANHMNITFNLSTRCLNRERLEIVSITSEKRCYR